MGDAADAGREAAAPDRASDATDVGQTPCLSGDGICPPACSPAQDGDCLRPAGERCTTAGECASGACVDGICCLQSCGPCQACFAPTGTCRNLYLLSKDETPPGTCVGTSACDGAGRCKLDLGQPCGPGGATSCATGYCTDGICCARSSCNRCEACNRPESPGRCTPVREAEDADSCSGTCDQAGICVPPPIGVRPKAWDFGSVAAGATSPDVGFVVENNAADARALTVTLAGGDARDFAITTNGCAGLTIAAGGRCPVSVRFQPGATGTKSALLRVTAAGDTFNAALVGRGY